MRTTKISGRNRRHRIFMYTLSTCAWCKMAKKFFKDNSIESEYIDVDLSDAKDYEEIRRDVHNRGGQMSFPVIIIDDRLLINGFQKDKIEKALEI